MKARSRAKLLFCAVSAAILLLVALLAHVRIALPLSKLQVAPVEAKRRLHSQANAHPLKVVTGKRNLPDS